MRFICQKDTVEGQEPGLAIVMLCLDCSVVIKSLNLLLTLIVWKISQKCIFVASNFKKRLREGFPGGSVVKNPTASAGDMSSIPHPGRSHMPWSPCATTTEPESQAWSPSTCSDY